MTHNITSSDLYHYNTLIKNLEDLQKKIILGKKHGTPGTPDDFQTKFDILFPNINTNYRDKITTAAGTGETSATFHPNNVSLKHLLHNSLYPYLYQTIRHAVNTIKKQLQKIIYVLLNLMLMLLRLRVLLQM